MKLKTLSLLFLLTFAVSLLADAVITEFSAEPSTNKIILQWKTGQEIDVNQFVIERGTNNRDFSRIGDLASKGSNSEYQFTDDQLSAMNNIYYYRLRVVNKDGSTQLSETIAVMPKISSFTKTWGSIKALFQ